VVRGGGQAAFNLNYESALPSLTLAGCLTATRAETIKLARKMADEFSLAAAREQLISPRHRREKKTRELTRCTAVRINCFASGGGSGGET